MWRFVAVVLCLSLMPVAASAEKPECNPPNGTDALWQRTDLQFVIFGEYHGTAEMPAAFGEMVCSALASGRNVLVGLEFAEKTGPAFNTYLNSPGEAADRARLIKAAFPAKIKDGTTSAAFFELTERFRQWRQAGNPLTVTAFQRKVEYDRSDGQTPYEKALAASLLEAADQHPGALVLVLVGSLHARKKSVGGAVSFEPMAMHLPQEKTLALVAVHEGGTAWNCRMPEPGGKLDCGPHQSRPSKLGREAPPGLKLGLGPDAAYDGFVKLGKITASPPVKPGAEE